MTMTPLSTFRDDFAAAVLAPQGEAASTWLAQPAFAVYRNTVMKACLDALEANYPSVARLTGREWFRAAAACFVREGKLPLDGVLLDYGASFADFLRAFAPAAALPYLADVARLDRLWTEAHTAADAAPLTASQLACLHPEALVASRIAPHPAARWAWFEGQPIHSIWSRNRQAEPGAGAQALVWRSEGALLTRPQHAVAWQPVGRAECAFLDACARGFALGDATEAAMLADPQADPGEMLARLLHAGALITLEAQGVSDETDRLPRNN